MSETFKVAGNDQVFSTIDNLANKVLHRDGTGIRLVGIRRRGIPIAKQVRQSIEEKTGEIVPLDKLGLKRYTDDLDLINETPELTEDPDLNISDDDRVVLVDDVMYTGRTLFQAATIVNSEVPERIRTMVLSLRSGRERPVHADYIGRELEIFDDAVIEVHVPPFEDDWGIYLEKPDE